MKNIDKVPDDEKWHFKKCPKCGEYFNLEILSQVFDHLHQVKLRKPNWFRLRNLGRPEEYLINKGTTKINLN